MTGQREAINRILNNALEKQASIEEHVAMLISMQMVAHKEAEQATERSEAVIERAQRFISRLSEEWQCTYGEAIARCRQLIKEQRFSAPGEDALLSISYREYLQSPHWQGIKEYALLRANYRCQLCNSTGLLDVHHRTYENKGVEDHNDVIALCRRCHSKFHDKEQEQ